MSGGGGSGTQQSTTKSANQLPGWEQEPAKAYLSSLMGYVFPGSTVPSSWFPNTKDGMSFPTGGAAGSAPGGTAGGGGSAGDGMGGDRAAAQMLQQIDPTGTSYGMFAPMISGSPYLQNMAAKNPAALAGATSPLASSQLASLYGGQTLAPGYGSTPSPQQPGQPSGYGGGMSSPGGVGSVIPAMKTATASQNPNNPLLAPPPPPPPPPPAPAAPPPAPVATAPGKPGKVKKVKPAPKPKKPKPAPKPKPVKHGKGATAVA